MDDELVSLALEDAQNHMAKTVEHVRGDFATVRTGRATPALVETLNVEYFGTPVPLRQLAGFSVPEARLLVISPYDKTSISSIERAIQTSDLGISPSNDGQVIRLAFPPLTEERRKELVRLVRHKAEEGRVAVRNLRRSARDDLKSLERDGSLSSDELERVEKDLEKVTHTQVEAIDQLLAHKEQELLEV
jgi:ribosome recycling factor